MKTLMNITSVVVVFYFLICVGCSENSTEPEPQEIPLDGRGGGVIFYCYQPLQNGIHQIYGINVDGSGNKKIIDASIGLNHHDISPDGTQFACVGYIGSGYNTWSIHVFNIDGTGLTRLTTTSNVWDNEPRWSPDGSRIAFTRIYPNDNNREEIRIMNSNGTDQHSIGIEGALGGWLPDGTRLIYASISNSNYEVFSCNTDGTDVQQITISNENEIYVSYSPDGSQIVCGTFQGSLYTSTNAGTYEVLVMNSDGTNRRQLTNNSFFDGSPRWSPDGTLIAFGSDETSEDEIYIMNVDGSNVRRVTNLPVGITAINPVWRPL